MKLHQMRPTIARSLLLGFPLLLPLAAVAQVPPGGTLSPPPGAVFGADVVVATTGDVTATDVRGSGSYSDYLYLDNPGSAFANAGGGVTGNWIFNNHLTAAGTTVDLGTFTAGTVLHFHVVADTTGHNWPQGTPGVQDSSSVLNWFTGAAALNADNKAHAFVDSTDYSLPLVGFEDLSGLGDAGYEDIQYNFSNVRAVAAPDAGSTLPLLGLALAGLAAWKRRYKDHAVTV